MSMATMWVELDSHGPFIFRRLWSFMPPKTQENCDYDHYRPAALKLLISDVTAGGVSLIMHLEN